MTAVSAQVVSCCVLWQILKIMRHMHDIIPCMFDYWADLVVHHRLLCISPLLWKSRCWLFTRIFVFEPSSNFMFIFLANFWRKLFATFASKDLKFLFVTLTAVSFTGEQYFALKFDKISNINIKVLYQPTYLPTYLPIYLPTYLPTYIPFPFD